MVERSLDELTLDQRLEFQELIDRNGLQELATSFHDLFRIPLKVFDRAGTLLADASGGTPLYTYLGTFPKGSAAVDAMVAEVKALDPGPDGEATYRCFTGAAYQITGIAFDGRSLGRLVLGPFLPPDVSEVSAELLEVEPAADADELKRCLQQVTRARPETAAQISRHLRKTLDLILFSGHKSLLTSNMHLASMRESFRDLQDQNAKLQDAYDRLKELDRLKNNFLATVSHELRTPLTSIIGYSEMLMEGIGGEITTEQREFISTIHEKGGQLLDLIQSLLDLSKLESGTLTVAKEELNVADLVRDVTATLTPAALKKGVILRGQCDDVMPKLWGDPTRLRQVLLNLTENAIKFTSEGGKVTLEVSMAEMSPVSQGAEDDALFAMKESAAEFRVIDSGIGVPDAEKGKIFDAFYQVDGGSTRSAGGAGLGLSIVRRLIEAHRGTIEVRDNEPQGSIFVVRLPYQSTSSPE
jgi:signal transduction histidine kinase